MKVRDDGVDNLEPVAGKDQQTGPAISGSYAVAGCRALQRANAGGPHGHHPVSAPPRVVDSIRRGLVDPEPFTVDRSEEHTSELQSHSDLVCRLLLEKKKEK